MTTEFEFRGKQKMIDAFDQAVALGNVQDTTEGVRQALIALYHDPDVELPDCCFEKIDDHYARRELYRSPDHGYSIVAMTWAPDQGTPIHDHCGLWCVESVWQGELEITQYELLDSKEDTSFQFRKCPCLNACTGSAGRLIPPHEYHTIHNRDANAPAISLHIYEKPMMQSAVFLPDSEDTNADGAWYSRTCKTLAIDELQ